MKHFHSKKVKCLLNEWRKVTVGGYNGSPLQYQNILQTLSKKVLYKNNYSVIFSSYYDSRGPPQYAI
ncbi:MAG: hypothetical protein ORN85_00160 [Sediminibacterium sp.]|nr:hypothetical protein [Sediminibacterium sp.]